MLVRKQVATRLRSGHYHPSPLKYVSQERSGYAATQWSLPPLPLEYVSKERSGRSGHYHPSSHDLVNSVVNRTVK